MFLFGVQYVAELSDRYLTYETDLFNVTHPADENDDVRQMGCRVSRSAPGAAGAWSKGDLAQWMASG